MADGKAWVRITIETCHGDGLPPSVASAVVQSERGEPPFTAGLIADVWRAASQLPGAGRWLRNPFWPLQLMAAAWLAWENEANRYRDGVVVPKTAKDRRLRRLAVAMADCSQACDF